MAEAAHRDDDSAVTDRVSDVWLWAIGIVAAALVIALAGCVGGSRTSATSQGAEAVGTGVIADVNAKIDRVAGIIKEANEYRREQIQAVGDKVVGKIEKHGVGDGWLAVILGCAGLFAVLVIGMFLWTLRSMKAAVCRFIPGGTHKP